MPQPKTEWGRRQVARYQALVDQVLEEGKVFDEKMRKTGMVQ